MRNYTFFVLLLLAIHVAFAESPLLYTGNGSYYMVERSDWSRYDNGKYSGLTRREVRSCIGSSATVNPEFAQKLQIVKKNQPDGIFYSGSFFILEETLKNTAATVKGISSDVSASFYISPDGTMTMIHDCGFPSYRSFPAYPAKAVAPGTTWQAAAVRAVDPLNKGIFTRLPMYVQYTFKGEETYKGQQVYRIAAKWATRYGSSSRDSNGDHSLKSASGTHDADILVLVESGTPMLIRDRMDETFTYDDGATVRLKGVTLFFTEFPPTQPKDTILNLLRGIADVKIREQDGESPIVATATDATSGISPTSGDNSVSGNVTATTDAPVTDTTITATGSPIEITSPVSATRPVSDTRSTPVIVEQTEAGLRLSVRNIRFQPDSAEIHSSESQRLDEIASVLKQVPDAMFLVEGHTASAGKPTGEQRLSEERAKQTASELSKRGINPDRFICMGYGSSRPAATGSSEAARAQNRRVEITILEY